LAVSPAHRILGAQRATDFVMEYLRTLTQQASESIQAVRAEHCAIEATLLVDKCGSCNWLRFRGFGRRRRLAANQRVHRYFHLRIREVTLNGVCRLSGALLSQTAAVADRLRNLAADLNCLAADSRPTSDPAAGTRDAADRSDGIRRLVAQTIDVRKTVMVVEMERALENEFRVAVTEEPANARRLLGRALRRAAQATVRRTLRKIGQQEMISSGEPLSQERTFSMPAALKQAASQWPGCGADRRLLLVVAPEGLSPAQLAEQLGSEASQPPTVVADENSDMLLCCELERLPLDRVAAAVLDGRFHNLEVASRLHTRIDVQWQPL
jgi:hypothetical protein